MRARNEAENGKRETFLRPAGSEGKRETVTCRGQRRGVGKKLETGNGKREAGNGQLAVRRRLL